MSIHPIRRFKQIQRRGAAALELALMMPIFLLLIIGILEFGRAMMIHQVATNSAREAARRAIIRGADDADVLNSVNTYLDGAYIKTAGRVVEIRNSSGASTSLSSINSRDEVTLFVSVPFKENSFGMASWFSDGNIQTQVKMRRE